MNATREQMLRQDVLVEARSWVGTPYHHEGFVKGEKGGVDCCMILVGIYCGLGLVPWFDPRPYPMQWNLHRSEEKYLHGFTQHATRVEVPQPGDVALFQFGRTVSHSGIITGGRTMIHAARKIGRVVEEEMDIYLPRLNSYWSVF